MRHLQRQVKRQHPRLPGRDGAPDSVVPTRIAIEPENVERGLVQLVLSLVELIRQLMEKQALRRMRSGRLTPLQAERLGLALSQLEEKMVELKKHFGIDDLNLDLGALGKLIDE